jgi:maltose alpha-D-glucosyltransferase/alpha-amylase
VGRDAEFGFSTANPQKLYLPVITDTEYNYEAVNVDNQIKNQSSLFWWTKKIIGIRKYFKAFGRGDIEFASPENSKILAYYRRYGSEVLFVAVNLSRRRQVAELDLSKYEGYFPTEVSGGTVFPRIGRSEYILTFDPFGYYIFSLTRQCPSSRSASCQSRRSSWRRASTSCSRGITKISWNPRYSPTT